MAKKAKLSAAGIPAAPPVLGMPAIINPIAQAFGYGQPVGGALEPRKIVDAKQRASEYKLDDGTILTIRPILIDVKRAKDQWGTNGKPIYLLTIANLNDTVSPPRLMDPRFISAGKRKKRKTRR